MSLNSWKQFQFYENIPIRDPQSGSETQFYSDPTLSAATLINSNRLVIAVNSTIIKVIDINKSAILSQFNAFDEGYRITYLSTINNTFLVAVAENTGFPSQFKLFQLDNLPKNKNSFHALVELKNGDNTFPISAISISKDLSCFVVGFINGKIILIRGDLSRDRGSKQRVIYSDIDQEPITSLSLTNDATLCYVSTTSKVLLFNTTGRNSNLPDVILNNKSGVDLNCGHLNTQNDEFICCHTNMIEFYKTNGEKRSIPFEMKSIKRLYPIDQEHLLLIAEENTSQETSLNMTDFTSTSVNRVLIIDIKNKIIALNFIMPSSVIDILSSPVDPNSSIFLLTPNGIMHKITEKNLNDKLNIVIQKQLFQFALDLAEANNLSALEIQEIHKQYGDFLYNKGSRSEAVEQYIQCLDVVETSEVISKFTVGETSDLNDIKNLAEYLWSLIKQDFADADHVTLLLIVLIKLKAKDEINHFLTHFSRLGKYSETPIKEDIDDETYLYNNKSLFNFKLVLNLLDESKFEAEAYKLAKKFSKDAVTIVEVLLDIMNDPWTALGYIKSLPIDDTLRVLAIFSKSLLETLPNDTNALLIKVFTGKYVPDNYHYEVGKKNENKSPADLRKIFYSYTSFIGYMDNYMSMTTNYSNSTTQNNTPTYHPPKPSIVFSSFISKPFQFVVFLEACLDSYKQYEGSNEDKQVILTTLYDLYLTLSKEDIAERQKDWKNKASIVLKESNKLVMGEDISSHKSSNGKTTDNSLMMLISHMNKVDIFLSDPEEGPITSLQDKTSLKTTSGENLETTLLNNFRSLTLTEEPSICMKFFEKYCEKCKSLYRVSLTYFISAKHILNEIGGEDVLREKIINVIVEKNIFSIIELIQILSGSSSITFGSIKNILISLIEANEEEISKTELLVESYEKELDEKKNKLKSITKKDEATSIQLKGKLCHMCETTIELPMVYFKCGHMYHQRCLNEEDFENVSVQIYKCPKCLVELESSNRLYEAQQEMSNKYDMFKLALEDEGDSGDRFKVVSEFIGRGGLDYSHMNI